jgi:hypothetical protein
MLLLQSTPPAQCSSPCHNAASLSSCSASGGKELRRVMTVVLRFSFLPIVYPRLIVRSNEAVEKSSFEKN